MILTLSFGGAKRICSLTFTSGLLLFNLNEYSGMKETRHFGHYLIGAKIDKKSSNKSLKCMAW